MTLEQKYNAHVTSSMLQAKEREERERYWDMLMEKALQSDGSAYESLLVDVSKVLRPRLLRKIGSAADSEELIQEILLALHSSRHTYQVGRHFAQWMYAIAQYKLHDFLRKKYRSKKFSDIRLDEAAYYPSPEEAVALRAELNNVVKDLSPLQQNLIKLSNIEDKSHLDIAEETGLSLSAVKTTLHRTYRLLKLKLGQK